MTTQRPTMSAADQQQHAEERIAELEGRVRDLERRLHTSENLLAIGAHELRNPMHALLLQVSAAIAIANKRGEKDLEQRLERIRHVVDMYVKRATLLLDVSHRQAKGWTVKRERCDIASITRNICEAFAEEAAFNRAVLRVDVPPMLYGLWDRMALEQIVGNLISNAIKYGAGDSIEVTIALLDEHEAMLSVADHGVGIPADDLERIFERFEQAVGSGDRQGGFGIGLWLVRSLVLAHGGNVHVESSLGRGSTFIVKLPLQAPTLFPR